MEANGIKCKLKIVPNRERDEYITKRFTEFQQFLDQQIAQLFPLSEGEVMKYTTPRVGLKAWKWEDANEVSDWDELLSLSLPSGIKEDLQFIFDYRMMPKYWWLEKPMSAEIYDSIGNRGKISRVLASLNPRYRFRFEGKDSFIVLQKGIF